MVTILAILQAPPMVSQPSALGELNKLGAAFFLVGIALLLLFSVHYYRRKGVIDRKGLSGRKKKKSHHDDPIMQLEYMSREELREMILKEKMQKDDQAAGNEKSTEMTGGQAAADEPLLDFGGSFITTGKNPRPAAMLKIDNPEKPETALIANLVAQDDENGMDNPDADEPAAERIPDRIQRSALSNELPEEFRKKSRKI